MKTHQITIYKDSKGEFRWRMTAKNGKVVAESGEGYKSKRTMMTTLNRMLAAVLSNAVVIVDISKAKWVSLKPFLRDGSPSGSFG